MQLNFREFGAEFVDNEPLLILHALFASGRTWQSQARRLSSAAERQVFTLDLRNHGATEHSSRMGYECMAQDVLQFCDERQLREVVLLGHSMGGKVAMILALAHPERCRALIALDIAPVAYSGNYADVFAGFKAVAQAAVTSRREANEILARLLPDEMTRQFILTNLINREGKLAWRLNVHAIQAAMPELASFPPHLKSLRYLGPAMFLKGEKSAYITEKGATAIRTLFPRAEIISIQNAGHWLNVEAPEAMQSEIVRFLNTV